MIYDIAIIGGGISACVFSSSYLKNGYKGRIAILENGRNLGGRSSTRNSIRNSGWQLNHGSPNFNICNSNNNQLLKTFIQELLDAKIIHLDPSDLIELCEDPREQKKIISDFHSCDTYTSSSSMSDLSKNILNHNNLKNQVDFFFQTLIVKLNYLNIQEI